MRHFPVPKDGQRLCPHCEVEFNVSGAELTFAAPLPHNDVLIFVLCRDCHCKFKACSGKKRKDMGNASFVNVKQTSLCTDALLPAWAMTTGLTLELNGDDLVSAFENGHGLTREQYFSICSGSYSVTALPGGGAIICSESPTDPPGPPPHASAGSTSRASRKNSSTTQTHRPDGGQK